MTINRELLLEKIADKLTDIATMEALLQSFYNFNYNSYKELSDLELVEAAEKILLNKN